MRRAPRKSGPMDPALRVAVLVRDEYTCQAAVRGYPHRCFGRLHVHHIRLRSQGGKDSLENLVSVCGGAHHQIHNVDRAGAERYGLIAR